MSKIREHRFFLLVLTAILFTRIAFTFAFPIVQVSDYQAYYEAAQALAGIGDGSPSLGNLGPKLFYAAVFKVFGDDLRVIGFANTLVYAGAITFLYFGALRVFGRATASATVVICFLSLSELLYNNLACSEILAMFFIAATFFILSRELTGWKLWLVMGPVAGLGAYVRSNTLAVLPLVVAYGLWRRQGFLTATRNGLGVQFVALVMTIPLALLHSHLYGRFTPVAPGSPENLWYGNNPRLRGDLHAYTQIPEELPIDGPRRKGMVEEYRPFFVNDDLRVDISKLDAFAASELKARYAVGWIKHNKARYAHLVVARFQLIMFHCTFGAAGYLHYDPRDPNQPRWAAWARHAMLGSGPSRTIENPEAPLPPSARLVARAYQGLAALAALGLIITILAGGRSWLASRHALPLLILAWYIAPFLLTLGLNRYKVPVLCMLWIYLGHGLVLAARGLKNRGANA